jgi:hypothetical protein
MKIFSERNILNILSHKLSHFSITVYMRLKNGSKEPVLGRQIRQKPKDFKIHLFSVFLRVKISTF